jgi:hypothetical protein
MCIVTIILANAILPAVMAAGRFSLAKDHPSIGLGGTAGMDMMRVPSNQGYILLHYYEDALGCHLSRPT